MGHRVQSQGQTTGVLNEPPLGNDEAPVQIPHSSSRLPLTLATQPSTVNRGGCNLPPPRSHCSTKLTGTQLSEKEVLGSPRLHEEPQSLGLTWAPRRLENHPVGGHCALLSCTLYDCCTSLQGGHTSPGGGNCLSFLIWPMIVPLLCRGGCVPDVFALMVFWFSDYEKS